MLDALKAMTEAIKAEDTKFSFIILLYLLEPDWCTPAQWRVAVTVLAEYPPTERQRRTIAKRHPQVIHPKYEFVSEATKVREG
jgi:hypothetical protein